MHLDLVEERFIIILSQNAHKDIGNCAVMYHSFMQNISSL